MANDSSALKIGVIGLGVMGQRMLERLQGHARLRADGSGTPTLPHWLQPWPASPVCVQQPVRKA